MGKTYALLCAVGDYADMGLANLLTWQTDRDLILAALVRHLHFEKENIHSMGQEGTITAQNFAHDISTFSEWLTLEDTFLFYFSGHGDGRRLVFSNTAIQMQSILTYIENLHCKNKIVILDCCCSGNFEKPITRKLRFEESINSFVGKGIAIMASASDDEVSRLVRGGKFSLYTGIVSAAMSTKCKVRKGMLSLNDINTEIFELMELWNRNNPEKSQHPIFRSSIAGTIYFKINNYQPYVSKKVYVETEDYIISSVKPLSTGSLKRLCAFVIPRKNQFTENKIAYWTKDIAKKIKDKDVHASPSGAIRFARKEACAIWCYFGYDENDIINHLHFAYTIWTSNQEMAQRYYRTNKNAKIVDGIYEWWNPDYKRLRNLQLIKNDEEAYIKETNELLTGIINLAEEFIADIHEVMNRKFTIGQAREKYRVWIQKVYQKYIRLSDLPIPSSDLYDWSQKVMDLAGCVVDFAILLESTSEESYNTRERWMIEQTIKSYCSRLENLKEQI